MKVQILICFIILTSSAPQATTQTLTSTSSSCSGVSVVLLVSIPLVTVVVVLVVAVWLLWKKKKSDSDGVATVQRVSHVDLGLKTRRIPNHTNIKSLTIENCQPASTGDSTYQDLDLATKNEDQSYSAGLIFCRRRPGKLKEGPVETAHDSFRETSREYEEIREERHSGCPPVEMSTVYTCAKFPKANGVETTKEYSSGVVTARCPQNKPELNSNDVTYTEVNFHKSPATSPHRTPDDGRDYVVYSVPLTNGSKDSSPPLYSTVAPH
ncbi:hypothetical protein Q8A73_013522 [Channa argus]|nr:hypothetical protein Q8A73_013522 [Channa argus]